MIASAACRFALILNGSGAPKVRLLVRHIDDIHSPPYGFVKYLRKINFFSLYASLLHYR